MHTHWDSCNKGVYMVNEIQKVVFAYAIVVTIVLIVSHDGLLIGSIN